MKFDKLHPILVPLIEVNEHGGVKCPACNAAMHLKNNYNKTLFWLKCIGCPNNVEIHQSPGNQYYDAFNIDIFPTQDAMITISFYCGKDRLFISSNQLISTELPKWESLKPDYITKKVKLYLTFS